MAIPGQPSRPVVAICGAAPAILAALWMLWDASGVSSRVDPEADMPFVDTLVYDRIGRSYEYIRTGEDPNLPIAYTDEKLTAGLELRLTPLLIAVANERTDTIKMLLSSGVTADAPGNRFAICLAKQLGQGRTVDTILQHTGPDTPTVCPPAPPDGAPALAAYVE